MEGLRRIGATLWKLWLVVCFVVLFLAFFPFFWICFITHYHRGAYVIKIIFSSLVAACSGLFPRVRNYNASRRFSTPVVFVCNHASYLDILLFPVIIHQTSIFIAKSELLKIPLFNMFFKYLDIPVDRKRPSSGKAALEEPQGEDEEDIDIRRGPGRFAKPKPLSQGAMAARQSARPKR